MIQRENYIRRLLALKDKKIVKIVTGVHGCGKSTLLFDLYRNRLIEDGVPEDNIVAISLDNIRNRELLDPVRLYEEVGSRIVPDTHCYVFLDEIQLVEGFEDAVNGIAEDFDVDVYITGSNSKFLSKDVSTKFRGRGMEIHMTPLTFSEFYSHRGGDKKEAFFEYAQYGGMPYVLQIEGGKEKADYLSMVTKDVLFNDVVDRYGVKDRSVLDSVAKTLYSSTGSKVASKRISDTLTTSGTKVDQKTVSSYIEHFCDAFLFYRTDRYDVRGREYLRTQPKYYPCDTGLWNAMLGFRQMEITHVIESIVYMELISRGYEVFVGSNREKEIDFVASDREDMYYIQVSYSVAEPDVRERELSAFRKIDDGYRKILVTMDEDPFTHLENGYKKVNLIDFLLDEDLMRRI